MNLECGWRGKLSEIRSQRKQRARTVGTKLDFRSPNKKILPARENDEFDQSGRTVGSVKTDTVSSHSTNHTYKIFRGKYFNM